MAQLPNADLAIVDEDKLVGYLLNPAHKVGWPKGRFLQANGFDITDVESIRSALLNHARQWNVASVDLTVYGAKYRVDGPLHGGSGPPPAVRTVWQIDTGQPAPRFVTMKPIRIA